MRFRGAGDAGVFHVNGRARFLHRPPGQSVGVFHVEHFVLSFVYVHLCARLNLIRGADEGRGRSGAGRPGVVTRSLPSPARGISPSPGSEVARSVFEGEELRDGRILISQKREMRTE